MADILKIGLSALLSHQRALAATSNNIANANTPGYSRQRVELAERSSERLGSSFVGTGVDVEFVRRITDDILAGQLRNAATEFHRSDVFSELASVLDNLLADQQTGLSPTLQSFVNAMQQVADDPGSQSSRQVFLSEARNLASRFNSLGAGIADLNRQILASGTPSDGAPPPELLDQRDRLLESLSQLIGVDTVEQSDGTVGVFIGTGQVLVLGTESASLAVRPGSFDPEQPNIVLEGAGPDVNVTEFLSGGSLGGGLDFRRELLTSARANIGMIALGLAQAFNTEHANGMDLLGNLGGDLFAVPAPRALAAATNAGSSSVTVSVTDLGALQPNDYQLVFDGSGYSLFRGNTGTAVAMTGSGTAVDPFLAEGISIVVAGAPATGDQFLLRTVSEVSSGLSVLFSDPARIAAAAPTRTRGALANVGNGAVSAGQIIDVTDPGLLATATIEFVDATTYSVNGAGSFAYTPGADIDINGTRIQITGSPAAGDQFVIEANAGGIGDNRNALAIAASLAAGIFNAGVTTLQGAASNLVTEVGAATAESQNRRDAQRLLFDQAEQKLESVRGVNLDEEAADLVRLEQLYQAAAQTVAVADSLFSTLLSALGRQ